MNSINHQIRLAARPSGLPTPSDWELRTEPVPAPAPGEFVVAVAEALRRAAAAHGRHEEEIGHPDPDWPDWYAQYMVQEQAGHSGPASPGAST